MKNLDQWLKEYGVSHQNRTNKLIHYFCVPMIYFSIVGLLLCIPLGFLKESGEPTIINWASLALIPILYFYARLSLKMAAAIFIFSVICIFINIQLTSLVSIDLWIISVFLFVIAWIFQFYGHKIEGQKPSFLEDIQFLLIGPAWIINDLFFKK